MKNGEEVGGGVSRQEVFREILDSSLVARESVGSVGEAVTL